MGSPITASEAVGGVVVGGGVLLTSLSGGGLAKTAKTTTDDQWANDGRPLKTDSATAPDPAVGDESADDGIGRV